MSVFFLPVNFGNLDPPGTLAHLARRRIPRLRSLAMLEEASRYLDWRQHVFENSAFFRGLYRFKGRILVGRSKEGLDIWVVWITSKLCSGSINPTCNLYPFFLCVFSKCTSWALWFAFPTWKKPYFSSPGGVYGPRWFARGIETGQKGKTGEIWNFPDFFAGGLFHAFSSSPQLEPGSSIFMSRLSCRLAPKKVSKDCEHSGLGASDLGLGGDPGGGFVFLVWEAYLLSTNNLWRETSSEAPRS